MRRGAIESETDIRPVPRLICLAAFPRLTPWAILFHPYGLEIGQGTHVEPVDAQNPNQVALLRGPQVRFALTEGQPMVSPRPVASLRIERSQGPDWVAKGEIGDIRLRPFGSIGDEVYQTYWELTE